MTAAVGRGAKASGFDATALGSLSGQLTSGQLQLAP